jgi:hypothetical protein
VAGNTELEGGGVLTRGQCRWGTNRVHWDSWGGAGVLRKSGQL